MAKDKKDQGIENIIYRAVEAGRISAERSARDAFKATERRLYAVPDLRAKLKDDQEELEDTRKYGLKERSHSITRFFKSGVRLTPEEIMEAVIIALEAAIAATSWRPWTRPLLPSGTTPIIWPLTGSTSSG